MSEMGCCLFLSLDVRIERVLDRSKVECVVTPGCQVLILRRDLMVLGLSIPLRGKGIPFDLFDFNDFYVIMWTRYVPFYLC